MREIIQLTVYADPSERSRAYITSHGTQKSFINGDNGDMYAMALEYVSYLTGGALRFVRKNGKKAPVAKQWNPTLWLERNKSK